MGSLIRAYINVNKIPKDEFKLTANGDRQYNFLISIDDERTKPFYTNVSISSDQTQLEREAKKPKIYTGNGRVVWTADGSIKVAEKKPFNDDGNDAEEPPF